MRLTLALKIAISATVIAITAIGISVYSFFSANFAANASNNIEDVYVPSIDISSDMSLNSLTAMSNVLVAVESGGEESITNLVNKNFDDLNKNIKAMQDLINTDNNNELLPIISQMIGQYQNAAKEYELASKESITLTKELHKMDRDLDKVLTDLINAAEEVYKSTENLIKSANDFEGLPRRLDRLRALKDIIRDAAIIRDIFKEITYTSDISNVGEAIKIINSMKKDIANTYANIRQGRNRDIFQIVIKASDIAGKDIDAIIELCKSYNELIKKRKSFSALLEEINSKMSDVAVDNVQNVATDTTSLLFTTRVITVVLIFVVIAISVVVLLIMNKTITRPIQNMVLLVNDLTKGDGDLTKRIKVDTNDELGDLAKEFNIFITNVQEIIGEVKSAADDVASGNAQLASTMEELSSNFENQSMQVGDIVRHMDNIANLSNNVVKGLDESRGILSDAARLTHNGTSQLNGVKDKILMINNQTDILSETIGNLSKSSTQIGEILVVINDIADQTNLLSLNASIEAARAGEMGRGFAVVADEVRKLAERTQKATSEIEVIITSLQRESESASTEMEKADQAVSEGVKSVDITINDFSTVVNGVDSANKDIENVNHTVGEQNSAVQVVSENTNMIASGIEESTVAVNEVTVTVTHLQDRAEQLKTLVEKFKV